MAYGAMPPAVRSRIWAEARRLFVIAAGDPLTDLAGLELYLDVVKGYGD